MKLIATIALLCLGIPATAQVTIPFVSSPTNPSSNVAGGYCDTASTPVYNYATNVYWYCVANTLPPTNRGTWTQSTATSLPISTTVNPNGTACSTNTVKVLSPGGTLYTCQNGTYAQASGGGGTLAGDVTGAAGANTVVKINGTSLAGLATGILKNTTATGAPSIAVAGDFPTLNQNTTGSAATATALGYCVPASASGTTYTCAPSPALTSYTTGTVVSFLPDVNGSGGATTLNVNSLGAKSVKQSDGSTNPASTDFVSGKITSLIYDGTVFREGPTGPTGAAGAPGAAGVAWVKHEIICSASTYTVDGGAPISYPATVTSFDVSLFTIASQSTLSRLYMKHSTALTGIANETSLTASVGVTSPITNRLLFSNGTLDVSTAPSNTNFLIIGGDQAASFASYTVTVTLAATCSSGNCYTSGLTVGTLDIWVSTDVLP